MGVLIEHYNGAFPVWLAPVQVRVMGITSNQNDYVEQVARKLSQAEIRVETDTSPEKIGYKIRQAQLQKIPYMLIVGAKEASQGLVSVRERSRGDLGSMPVDEFVDKIKQLNNPWNSNIKEEGCA